MIDLCRDCPKYASCTNLCPDIEKRLPKVEDGADRRGRIETRVSNLKLPDGDAYQSIDDARKIDSGRIYEEVESDLEVVWENKIYPQQIDLTEKEWGVIKKYTSRAIPYHKTTLNRRFYAFLRCDSMVQIAKRANTSYQNIQKQFQGVINRIHKFMSRDELQNRKEITPLKFKRKFVIERT